MCGIDRWRTAQAEGHHAVVIQGEIAVDRTRTGECVGNARRIGVHAYFSEIRIGQGKGGRYRPVTPVVLYRVSVMLRSVSSTTYAGGDDTPTRKSIQSRCGTSKGDETRNRPRGSDRVLGVSWRATQISWCGSSWTCAMEPNVPVICPKVPGKRNHR